MTQRFGKLGMFEFAARRPRLIFVLLTWLAAILWATMANAANAVSISSEWKAFQANPKVYMLNHPTKTDEHGLNVPLGVDSAFSRNDIATGKFSQKKLKFRSQLTNTVAAPLADPSSPRVFAGELNSAMKIVGFLDSNEFAAKGIKPILKLSEVDRKGLVAAQLKETPWSDSYWPIYQGVLGARYASRTFHSLGSSWDSYSKAVSDENSFAKVLGRQNPEEINSLSPSEKYDMLIGDPLGNPAASKGFLTPGMWTEGKSYMDAHGKVETWMGICHGWAPASFMISRPRNLIAAARLGSTGSEEKIKFYPSDLKGLVTYIWAKAGDIDVHFLGQRCNSKEAKTDPDTGRLLDKECFDVNPGIWHMSLVNQIGQAQRSVIIDATFDYEVWNQPVFGYSYTYFNPQTGETSATAREAMIASGDYTKDKFSKFRSADGKSVVGVEMTLKYIVETSASHNETDSPENDSVRTVKYVYDLELDAEGEVIGGEWYQNQHPDFIWLPMADAHATSLGDSYVTGAWDPSQPLPKFWRDIAIATAVRYGQPLSAIVDAMVKTASR